MNNHKPEYDVVVVGAGNAGLNAAIAANEGGANVLVLEKAPEYLRGGNTYFTGGGFRFAYNGIEDLKGLMPEMSESEAAAVDVGSYPQDKFYSDIMRVTEGLSDPELLQLLVSQSYPTMKWMLNNGVTFVLMYKRQAFEVDGIHKFWGGMVVESVGAGVGLIDTLF